MNVGRSLEEVLRSVSDVLFPAELGEKPVEINSVGADGDTPLHVMAWRNDTEGAKLLIKSGANVDAAGDMSETPLHVAIGQGNVELAKELLSAGANPNLKSEFGKTAKEKAALKGGPIAQLF